MNSTDLANYAEELKTLNAVCTQLLQTPHYQKMGQDGIFAIVQTAKSLGIDPRLALGGGLFYVQGKVEMSSRLMSALIRSRKHSIVKDEKSNDKICILHGKRADNGDEMTVSFSMEEAIVAGITGNPTWKKYPADMLYARALSRLARRLFPDIIGNCYVEDEIYNETTQEKEDSLQEITEEKKETITKEEHDYLNALIDNDTTLLGRVLKAYSVQKLEDLPKEHYDSIVNKLRKNVAIRQKREAVHEVY